MSREHPQMRIRLPPELKDQIESESKANGRSMNAEIILRLERSLAESDGPAPAALKEEIKKEILDELAGLIREAVNRE